MDLVKLSSAIHRGEFDVFQRKYGNFLKNLEVLLIISDQVSSAQVGCHLVMPHVLVITGL